MTTTPYVELRYNPTDLRPRDLPKIGEFLGTPSDAIEAALMAARMRMIYEMKTEVRGLVEPTQASLLRAADLAWQAVFWRYRKISAPMMADAYIRAYRAAGAGDVPMSVIYDLADKHAEKIGDYFHGTSRDALAQGFNTLVNRRIPARAAADRVLDAYGLTPRQMHGFTSNKQFMVPVESAAPLDIKARVRAYVDRSFTQRVRKLARQEEHNIDEQAKQFAWMWMQEKGKLSPKAQKMWITARDERVCPVCGPLHGQKVGVNEQFKTGYGQFWTPGLHPNCRCVVRLIENRFSKADDWDPEEHPRGGDPENRGRFSRVAERPRGDVIRIAEPDVIEQAPPVPDISDSVLADIQLPTGALRPIADISSPADITTPAPDIDAAPAPDIDVAPVADIEEAPVADILGLALPTAPKVADISVVQVPPKKTFLRPYEMVDQLPEEYYTVISGAADYQQFGQQLFSTDRDQIIVDAAETRENAINHVMDQHVVDGMVKYKEQHSSYGIPLEARIDADEFRRILEVMAQHTTEEKPVDALIEVDFFDPEGYPTDPPVETIGRTVDDIAHSVGIDPRHLMVNIVKLESVHAEGVGRGTAQRAVPSSLSPEGLEITGDYAVNEFSPEYVSSADTGTPVGMDIYTMIPHDPAVEYLEEPDND